MTQTPETAQPGNFSKTVAQEVEILIRKLAKPGKNLTEEVSYEISYTNPVTLLGAAKTGLLLQFLKEKLSPKQYEQALGNCMGWISGIAHQLLKLAPILGSFTPEQLGKISLNLSPQAVYKLAVGRTPAEVIQSILEKACNQEVSKKDIQLATKQHKDAQPKKEPTPWRYVGQGREYQPPRISEEVGLVIEKLREENGMPRRFIIEEAVLLLTEKFQQVVLSVA